MRDRIAPIAGLLPLLCIYLFSMPTTLPDFDAGEFAVVAKNGGIAHPPGYPLLTVIYWLTVRVNSDWPVVRVLSLTSICFTVLAAYIFYRVLAERFKNKIASLISVYVCFLAEPVWRAATTLEPFALNVLFASVCVYAAWKVVTCSNQRFQNVWFGVSGLIFGLSFCNHHAMAFMLPFAVLVWLYYAENKFRSFCFFSGCALLGLIPLVYFFTNVAQQGAYIFGDWSQRGYSLVYHVLRRNYGTFSLMADQDGGVLNAVVFFLKSVVAYSSIVWLPAIVLGGAGWIKQDAAHATEKRFDRLIAIAFIFVSICFFLFFKIDIKPLHLAVAERFHALPMVLLCFPVCYCVDKVSSDNRRFRVLGLSLAVILCMYHGISQWPESERKNERFYENHIINVLSTVEKDSVIVTNADADYFGLLYGIQVLSLRSDVKVLQYGLWKTTWYRKRFANKNNLSSEIVKADDIGACIASLLDQFPVYILNPEIMAFHPFLHRSFPIGPLIRLSADETGIPDAVALFRRNQFLFDERLFVPNPESMRTLNAWETYLVAYYSRTWKTLNNALIATGDKEKADMCQNYIHKLTKGAM
ncbi:MAG: hypothetical protein CSA22_04735 [Deltaproteobacteria bacterium]|nr:MAG: hypothetical protein CSA22_04735 [Deltaproteobacteria bacterium]